jgi:hypothetical protein
MQRRIDRWGDSSRQRGRLGSGGSETGESEGDSEPPALEDCSPRPTPRPLPSSRSLGPATAQAPQDWYVFDPVYGVIPQETR